MILMRLLVLLFFTTLLHFCLIFKTFIFEAFAIGLAVNLTNDGIELIGKKVTINFLG